MGWRFVIQKGDFHGDDAEFSWRTIRRSRLVTAIATDRTPAAFDTRRWRSRRASYRVRIVVKAYWLRNGEVVADSKLQVRFYRYAPLAKVFRDGCNG